MSKKYTPKWKTAGRNFYQTDRWREIRKKVIDTYGKRCMKCHILSQSPHVDHIRPRSIFPALAYKFENLQVLCKSCNEEKGQKIADYRKEILTPKSPPPAKLRDWQFFDSGKVEHNNGRSLSPDEIKALGFEISE